MRALGGHRRHGGGFARLPRRSGHAARLLSGQGRTGPRRAGPWLRGLAWLAVSACLLPGPPAALVIILPCRHALTLSLQPAPSAVRGPSARPAPPGPAPPLPLAPGRDLGPGTSDSRSSARRPPASAPESCVRGPLATSRCPLAPCMWGSPAPAMRPEERLSVSPGVGRRRSCGWSAAGTLRADPALGQPPRPLGEARLTAVFRAASARPECYQPPSATALLWRSRVPACPEPTVFSGEKRIQKGTRSRDTIQGPGRWNHRKLLILDHFRPRKMAVSCISACCLGL